MFGLVVVDVPTMQTNQPYTYRIPAELADHLEVGMRVVVPFGRGRREVQGFLVDKVTETDYDPEKLKPISAVVDVTAVLNPEMLALGAWLAETNFAFLISVYQAMLPNVMRAKYRKVLQALDLPALVAHPSLGPVFQDRHEVPLEAGSVDFALLPDLQTAQRQGLLQISYEVENQAHARMLAAIKPLLTPEAYAAEREKLRPTAKKQARLLRYLMTAPVTYHLAKAVIAELDLDYATLTQAEKKGWLEKTEREAYRIPQLTTPVEPTVPLNLNAEQQVVQAAIAANLDAQQAHTFLLEGVTGSGKTEVYLQTIQHALSLGQTALMLVPEITLTPQMVRRVKGRFGDQVAVLHSGLSDGERYDEWRRIDRQEVQVVVGARSAIFAPLQNLGLIIIDEEHETTYKQDENPRYHARDVAQWRSEHNQATLVLGSATPALESRARAQQGVYTLLTLTQRATAQTLPAVEIIDLREAVQNGESELYSQALLTEIQARMDRGEQTVLMLNRRGYANYVTCRDCGFTPTCENCDLALTLHQHQNRLVCHYCGYYTMRPNQCQECQSNRIRPYGAGTEKAESVLRELLPDVRIIRMDQDTTRKKGATDALLEQFGQGEADVLLGTQMIAKGLDFPNVTLVGVLNADTTLKLPDFRAAEKTFQLLTQVAGRAGRGDKIGQVLLQTFNPEHYAIQLAKAHDYEAFYAQEMQLRREWRYNPYYYTVQITIMHEQADRAAQVAYQTAQWLQSYLDPNAVMLGPSSGSVERLKNKYRYQILIKYKQGERLMAALTELMGAGQRLQREKITLIIDREPANTM